MQNYRLRIGKIANLEGLFYDFISSQPEKFLWNLVLQHSRQTFAPRYAAGENWY